MLKVMYARPFNFNRAQNNTHTAVSIHHTELRTEGFCWEKSFTAPHAQLVHSDLREDSGVQFISVI